MSWELLIAGNILFSSISTILQKIIMKDDKSDPVASAIFFQILGFSIVFFWALLTGNINFNGISNVIPNLILVAILIGGFYLFIFKSLKLIDASMFVVILATRPIFTILASTLLLHEGLVFKQYIGLIAILAGVGIVSLQKLELHFGKGELFALLAAICVGFAGTNDRIALNNIDFIPYLLLSSILPGVFIAVTNVSSLPKLNYFLKLRPFLKMLLMTIIQLGAIVTFLGAMKYGNNSSQIISISEVNVILTVILGVILLNERDNLLRKIIGSILAVIGMLLVG